MDNTTLNPVILGITAVAILASGLLLWNNNALKGEIESLKASRTSISNDAKAANERANVAERSMDEAKAETAKVQAANETINHSVTQLRNQVEQVQIQANTAREDFENRLKASGDDLAKAQGDVQRVNDDLAKERTAKDDALKTAARLQDELAKDRADREAAARASNSTIGPSSGTPPQANAP